MLMDYARDEQNGVASHVKLSFEARAVATARGSQTWTFSSNTENAHGTHSFPDGDLGVVHASTPSFHDRTLNPRSRSGHGHGANRLSAASASDGVKMNHVRHE